MDNGRGVTAKTGPTALTPEQRALAALLMTDEADEHPIKPKEAKRIVEAAAPGLHGGITLRRFIERGYVRVENSEVLFTRAGRQTARPLCQGRESELSAAIAKSPPKAEVASPKLPTLEPTATEPASVPQTTTSVSATPPSTPPSTPPADPGKEVGELNRRILEDLALTEREKADKLNDRESLAVIIRYTRDRKLAQQMRAALVYNNLLKGIRTDAKDGRARWYGAYIGPFSRIRHLAKDTDLLERVKPLTKEEARAIVGKAATPAPTPISHVEPATHAEPCDETPLFSIEPLTARIIEEHRLLIRLKDGKNLSNAESLAIFKRYHGENRGSVARVKLVARGILMKVGDDFALSDCKLVMRSGKPVSQARLRRVEMLTPEEGLRILGSSVEEPPPPPAELEPVIAPPVVEAPPLPLPELVQAPKADHSALILRLVAAVEHAQSSIDTARRKLTELAETRAAILATLAEADRAIAEQEATLAQNTADQQAARDAIVVLTNG